MTDLISLNVSGSDQEDAILYAGLFSRNIVQELTLIDFIIIYTIVCVFGMITNAINIFVYLKMHARDTVNVSLLSLSIFDLLSLFFLLLVSISYYPFWNSKNLGFSIRDIHVLFFAWPQFCFRRISNWITAFITFERCVCIAVPLKVKSIITPRRTVAIIVVIVVVMSLTISPAYVAASYQWTFDTSLNRTVVKLVAYNNSAEIDAISVTMSFVLTNVTFVWVIVCTTVLVVSLQRKSKWREATTSKDQSGQVSKRDKKVIRMIILLSVIFIITFIPDVITLLTMIFDQRVSIYGQYFDLFLLLNGISEPLLGLGSTVNLFVYIAMSSNFKKTLLSHLRCQLYCDINQEYKKKKNGKIKKKKSLSIT